MKLREFCLYLESLAPLHLAEDWDNVGLLVGDPDRPVSALMTCLTITPQTTAEAVQHQADLVVTHHPLPFRPLNRITHDSTAGRLLLQLIESRIAVYSAHTAYDSAMDGINQQLAQSLGLERIEPLLPAADSTDHSGSGRMGHARKIMSMAACAEQLKQFLHVPQLGIVGDPTREVQRIAVACGSAGEFLDAAHRLECDVLVVGETSFHTCLEAEARSIGLILTGHYWSERFAMVRLAERLAKHFPNQRIWASTNESDPIQWL